MIRRLIPTALLAAFLALPAMAGGPNFYHRTATKPPITGEWVAGPTLGYAMQFQPGVAVGFRWQNGIQVLGNASLLRLDAQDGSTPYAVGCRTLYADYTTGAHTTSQVGVMVLFPLRKLAQAAK
jgi:hypothetical protein